MFPESFIIWLQGYLDATGPALTEEQTQVIKAKLAEVQLRGPFRQRQMPAPTA